MHFPVRQARRSVDRAAIHEVDEGRPPAQNHLVRQWKPVWGPEKLPRQRTGMPCRGLAHAQMPSLPGGPTLCAPDGE